MANGWSVFVGLVIIIAFSVAAYFLAPKGENQLIWRSTLIMSAVACYLMWAITLLAQLNPLINPQNNHLRLQYS